jgi:hypothetical protein
MVDFATAIGSSWGIAACILLIATVAAFIIAWKLRGPDPYVVSFGIVSLIAAVFCMLVAFGYVEISLEWVPNPVEIATE